MSTSMVSSKLLSRTSATRSGRVFNSTRLAHFTAAPLSLPRRNPFLVHAEPEIDVKKAVDEAVETCKEDENSAECSVAWDTVEELSAASAHKKQAKKKDPLEEYCEETPEADECRVYEE